MKIVQHIIIYCIAIIIFPAIVSAASSIVNSKHNLSSSGPGEVRAISEDRICIFCHTPHHATPQTPLWNKSVDVGQNYTTYDSTTFNATLDQPSGPSRLCLSCHDGTIGLGAVLSVPGGIDMSMDLLGRPSLLGENLADDHPVSYSYSDVLPFNNELHSTSAVTSQLITYGSDAAIHCSTCHNPHDDSFGMFLAVDNKNSGLCTVCHNVTDWSFSDHATSSKTWSGNGNDPWPLNERLTAANKRITVAENGCENCHTPHNAGGAQRLMNYLEEEKNCTFACHNGEVSEDTKDIAAQFLKSSRHPVEMANIEDITGTPHDPTEDVTSLTGHVECQDCHNEHSVFHDPALAPFVSGALANVKGIDENGSPKDGAAYEFEICFKCHAESHSDTSSVDRYLEELNTRLAFATTSLINNPSFHPVLDIGRNTDVPSLPSITSLDQSLSESSIIYCSDCHSSNGTTEVGGSGPNGPHGSIYSPILRERYEQIEGTTESYAVYALCYRCHERNSILTDVSFQKRGARGGHSEHIITHKISCAICHDPHGIVDDLSSGDHTNLINFRITVVTAASGQTVPLFTDNGTFSGSCTLMCHGIEHDGSATYSYP